MKIEMLEDDKVLINRVMHHFDEGQVTSVPEWAGRSLIEKGTARRPEQSDDEAFANAEGRETKAPAPLEGVDVESVTPPVEAEPTAEGSAWYQFEGQDGELLLGDDGEPHKAHGSGERDEILEAVNST
jgi:hypothetical protein